MGEAISIRPKDDKENALKQCLGRLFRQAWQVNAARYMIRDITESDMEMREATETVLCNGLLAATSLMMTDLDKVQELLDLPNPDWDKIKQNQPFEMDLATAIKDAGTPAEGQKSKSGITQGQGRPKSRLINVSRDRFLKFNVV